VVATLVVAKLVVAALVVAKLVVADAVVALPVVALPVVGAGHDPVVVEVTGQPVVDVEVAGHVGMHGKDSLVMHLLVLYSLICPRISPPGNLSEVTWKKNPSLSISSEGCPPKFQNPPTCPEVPAFVTVKLATVEFDMAPVWSNIVKAVVPLDEDALPRCISILEVLEDSISQVILKFMRFLPKSKKQDACPNALLWLEVIAGISLDGSNQANPIHNTSHCTRVGILKDVFRHGGHSSSKYWCPLVSSDMTHDLHAVWSMQKVVAFELVGNGH
jgi:hypothetical protein